MAYIGKSFSADQVQRKVGTLAFRVPKNRQSDYSAVPVF